MKLRVLPYALTHFLVDFCCAFLMFRVLDGRMDMAAAYLIYNFCAFAVQMPLGVVADRVNHNGLVAALGCGLVLLGFALSAFVLPALLCIGLGNALFHVGGGLEVLNVSKGRAAPLGVFVSPGAAGITLGTLLGKGGFVPLWLCALCLLAALLLLLWISRGKGVPFQSNNSFELPSTRGMGLLLPLLGLFLVVVLRSLLGFTAVFAWKTQGAWWVAGMLAVVLGKAAGGFLSDALGAKKAALVSLLPASVLFLLGENPFAGVAALFLFNMTMPVTLSMAARLLPGLKGFSFGLLTFGLFLGFLPVWSGTVSVLPPWALCGLTLLSALLLVLSCTGKKSTEVCA